MVKAYSNFNASMYIGTGIAALLGAGLYEKLGSHVLLIAEFIIYSTAILLLSMLPNAHRPMKENVIAIKERLKKFWVAVRYILKSRKYCYLVLFSGFMVGVSHFFFWSFQPLMKTSGINPSVSLTDLADVYIILAEKLKKSENIDDILPVIKNTDKTVEKTFNFLIENMVIPNISKLQRNVN
jgi:hypothetical protein